MIGQYLLNNNENVIVSILQKILHVNRAQLDSSSENTRSVGNATIEVRKKNEVEQTTLA
jgi:hypothetical protein